MNAVPLPTSNSDSNQPRLSKANPIGDLAGRRVLVVSTFAPFAYKMAQCFDAASVRVDLLSPKRLHPLRLSKLIDRTRYLPAQELRGGQPEDAPKLAERLNHLVQRHQYDAVFASDLMATRALAAAVEARPEIESTAHIAPLSPLALLDELHDKARFADFLSRHHLPIPGNTVALPDAQAVSDFDPDSVTYPVICKPTEGSNSEGVVRIDDAAAMRQHLAGSPDAKPPLLIQDFVPGEDVDLSFLAEHGRILAWTIQHRENFTDTHISFFRHEQVLRAGRQMVEKSGFHGVGHMDLRIDEQDGSVKIIELNPRYWGSVQYSMWAGVNFPALHLAQTLGGHLDELFQPVAGEIDNQSLSFNDAVCGLLGRREAPIDTPPIQVAAAEAQLRDPVPSLVHALRSAIRR